MKNIFLLILIINGGLFSQSYNTYEMEFVKEFQTGRETEDINKLGVEFGQGYGGPSGPNLFFRNNDLMISDFFNSRFLVFNEDTEFKGVINNGSLYGYSVIMFDETALCYLYNENLSIYSEEYNIILSLHGGFNRFLDLKDYFFHSGVLFVVDKSGKIWSLEKPGTNNKENLNKLKNQEETVEIFTSGGDFHGLTIDSENRFFINGELRTTNYKTFIEYMSEHNTGLAGTINGVEITYEKIAKFNINYFIGRDRENNTYWSATRTILVFDATGKLIEKLRFDRKKTTTVPAVSALGDIFFIDSEEEKVTLYKIEREW